MATHTFNPNRARQLAAIHAKERATPGEFHHLQITPVDNGYVVSRHRRLGTHMQGSQFKVGGGSLLGGQSETELLASHHVANAYELHDHLDDVLGENVAHRPVGQHLAVHIPQRGTQNGEPIAS